MLKTHTYYCKGFSIEGFKMEIKKRFKGETDYLFFSTMSDMYYADYKPKFPEKSAADICIGYCWITGEAKMYGNLEAMIPTIKEFGNIGELFDCLDESGTTIDTLMQAGMAEQIFR